MKDVISNILDIENKANEIIEEAKKEKTRLEMQMKEDLEKMQQDINAMVADKLMQLDKKEKNAAKENLKRINETAENRLVAMDEFYEKNRSLWVKTVFEIITGSEKSGS